MDEKSSSHDFVFDLLILLGVSLCFLLSLMIIFAPVNAKALTETNVINGITAGQYCTTHPQASVCTAQMYQSSSGNPCGNGDARCITYFSGVVDNRVLSINFYLNTAIQGYTLNTLTLYGSGFDNVSYSCSMSYSSCVVVRYSDHLNINFTNNTANTFTSPIQFDIYTNAGFNSNKSFRLTGAKLFQNDIGDSSSGSSFDDSGIISSANQNTQDIINTDNQNTKDIINAVDDSNFICKKDTNMYDYIFTGGFYLENNGTLLPLPSYGYTDFIKLTGTTLTIEGLTAENYHLLFYDEDYNKIVAYSVSNSNYTIPSNAVYFRFSISNTNVYTFKIHTNGCIYVPRDMASLNKQDETLDFLKDDNVDSSTGSSFFNDFTETDHGGISGIVTRPLIIVNDLISNNNKCDNLNLPSFMGVSNAYLPSGCIFWNNVPTAGVTVWNIFVCGFCSYIILVDLFHLIQKVKDPMSNVVEVMKL